MAENAAVPTALLCAYGVKYQYTLTGTIAKSFDENFEKVSGTQGTVRILGIDIKIGGEREKDTDNTHTVSYDKLNRTVTVLPSESAGTGAVLAVIGEKL